MKFIINLLLIIKYIYDLFTYALTWKQRKKELPIEIQDIYSKERYEEFIAYKKEYKKIYLAKTTITFIFNLIVFNTNFFSLFDNTNPYITFFSTLITLMILSDLITIPFDYYSTFYIDEKFQLNKKTKAEFFKDTIIEEITQFIASIILYTFMIYICSNLSNWTNHYCISYFESFMLVSLLTLAIFMIVIVISMISLLSLKLQYTFTELEPGELRTKIEEFQKDSKKKVKHIKIYNESKKSNSKNAFLLKLGPFRLFGIADNFMNENAQDELYAVSLHEIGHLKHKKNIWNYIQYIFFISIFCFLVWLLPNANLFIEFKDIIQQSFHIQYTNYYLTFTLITLLFEPILFFINIYHNYVSCKEEKEADYNAVDQGYGQALIQTFKKISTDELIDVHPHPWIELLEYDHPSMYKRIRYIQKRMQLRNY